MAIVYWIRLPSHKDMFSEGYIGYSSKSVEERFTKHVADALGPAHRNYTLHNAIRKYGAAGLVKSVIIVGNEDYCLLMEESLRPDKSIGWNQAKGGFKPPSMLGNAMSNDTKSKISVANRAVNASYTEAEKTARYAYLKGIKRSEDTLKKYVEVQKGKHPGWTVKNSNSNVWCRCQELFDYFTLNSPSAKKLGKAFFLTESNVNAILKNFRKGWIPSQDESYLDWLKQYKEAQNAQA